MQQKPLPSIYHSYMSQWVKEMIHSHEVQDYIQDCVQKVSQVMHKSITNENQNLPNYSQAKKRDVRSQSPMKRFAQMREMSQLAELEKKNNFNKKQSSIKILNRDRVEIDINKDLEQLRRMMMSMNINNNDRQQLTNLFAQMATNKEIMYNETLKMSNGLTKLNQITESLQTNQDMLQGMQDETRMIFRYIKDQEAEYKGESPTNEKTPPNIAGSPRHSVKSNRSGFTYQITSLNVGNNQNGGNSTKNQYSNRSNQQNTFVTGAVRVANSLDRKEETSRKQMNTVQGEDNDLRLLSFLREWDKEEPQTNYDIELYANELWVTAKQFEEDLKKHYNVYAQQITYLNRAHHKRENTMKEKLEFYIESQDKAINQLKLDIQKMKEQYEMQICDYQSFLQNQHIPFDEVNNLVRMDNLNINPENQSQTDFYIKQLQKCIRSLKLDVKHLETQLIYAKKDINQLEEKCQSLNGLISKGRDFCIQGAAQLLKFLVSVNIIDEEVGKGPLIAFRDNSSFNQVFSDKINQVYSYSSQKLEQVSKHFLQMKKILQDSIKKNAANNPSQSKKQGKSSMGTPRASITNTTPLQSQGTIIKQSAEQNPDQSQQQLMSNEQQRTVSLILAHYMSLETLDGQPKELKPKDGKRMSIILSKSPPIRKNTIRAVKGKKSKFGSMLQIPDNDVEKLKENSQDSKSNFNSPFTKKTSNSLINLGSPGKRSKQFQKQKSQRDPIEKYKIDFEAFRDEDDRLTYRQGSYLIPYIEYAVNRRLSKDASIDIVNQISVEKLIKKMNELIQSSSNEKRKAVNFTFPLVDLIEILKNKETGEVSGFQINPKMARLLFIKSLNDEIQIRDLLTYVAQLNRVLNFDSTLKITNLFEEKKVDTKVDQEIQTYFPDYFREKLRSLYLSLTKEMPEDEPSKYEKQSDSCDTQKDIVKQQYEKQFEAFNKLREYENKIENAGEEFPKKGETFKFKLNFDEFFMDEKTLIEMKKTLTRLTQKMSRRKAMNQSNDDILGVVGDDKSNETQDRLSVTKKGELKNSFSRKESIVKAEVMMAERYQSLMCPLDEVIANILQESEKNGIFIENTKIDQLLAAALREEDQSYAIEIFTQFLTKIKEVISQHPEFHTILQYGKNNSRLGEQRVVMSKEEKEQYFKAKIEDLEKLINRQKQNQLSKFGMVSSNLNNSVETKVGGGTVGLSKLGSLIGDQLKKRVVNTRIVQQEIQKREENPPEKTSLERKKTNLFMQSRKQANKFLLNPSDQDINNPPQNDQMKVKFSKVQQQVGQKEEVKVQVNDKQKSRRRSILQSQQYQRNMMSFTHNDQQTVLSYGTQESADINSGIMSSQRSTARDSNQINIITQDGFFDLKNPKRVTADRKSSNKLMTVIQKQDFTITIPTQNSILPNVLNQNMQKVNTLQKRQLFSQGQGRSMNLSVEDNINVKFSQTAHNSPSAFKNTLGSKNNKQYLNLSQSLIPQDKINTQPLITPKKISKDFFKNQKFFNNKNQDEAKNMRQTQQQENNTNKVFNINVGLLNDHNQQTARSGEGNQQQYLGYNRMDKKMERGVFIIDQAFEQSKPQNKKLGNINEQSLNSVIISSNLNDESDLNESHESFLKESTSKDNEIEQFFSQRNPRKDRFKNGTRGLTGRFKDDSVLESKHY